ncbi:hypothetical protein AGR7A_pAt20341 [Agrobacterium deltaense NCPPB 1641]|uniref:Uncharacterized protein n=1 Tax=Agrobacterium deltaense NCPPB 1641 TaxID=1183425 RepID=A0A1S7U9Z3_9HYPH|nr:hypothetical protein AGR7A_pAt20341 [Agrobacterium deltaense NCPPB 1641]
MLVEKELANAAFPGAHVGKELLQALDATIGEGCDALVRAVLDMDHLAVVDVVGITRDFFKQLEVLNDQRGDIFDRVDMRRARLSVPEQYMG